MLHTYTSSEKGDVAVNILDSYRWDSNLKKYSHIKDIKTYILHNNNDKNLLKKMI